MMAEEGVADFWLAKRKAARQLGLENHDVLPRNEEIEAELRTYQALYQEDEHPHRVRDMRRAAADLMRELEAFTPYVTGAVADGTAARYSSIELNLYAGSSKEVEVFLLNRQIRFESREPRRRDRAAPETVFMLEWQDYPVEMAVYPRDAERAGGRERLRLPALLELLQESD
ncbi:MAG: hypothetical protein KF778_21885 [Rhodocyclaceae bacterium]|nr:hypothetical protein [Rhodocyclaceae bacterium]MBX3671055.1 hypothetical protein [Rhodocyclaceae bacterium]